MGLNLGLRPWLSAKKYFEYLCDKEAGQFIYRTVEGVDSVFQMRPRLIATDLELADRYVMPDPYGSLTLGGRPAYVEVTVNDGARPR